MTNRLFALAAGGRQAAKAMFIAAVVAVALAAPATAASTPPAAVKCAMIWPRTSIVKIRFSLEEHHRFSEIWITPCKTASRVPLRAIGRGVWLPASGESNPPACGTS